MIARRSDAIPMVGKRYGGLVVLSEAGNRGKQRLVKVRCDCGRAYVTGAQHVRNGRAKRCVDCHHTLMGATSTLTSVRLSDGRTIVGIAKVAGLDLNTVYRRWLRGWPPARLGEPLVKGGARRPYLGGSVDLPERRCLVFPKRAEATA